MVQHPKKLALKSFINKKLAQTKVKDLPKRLILFGIWIERILDKEIFLKGRMGEEKTAAGGWEEWETVEEEVNGEMPVATGKCGIAQDGIEE